MNPLTNVKNITKLNEIELSRGLTNKKSWHDMYSDSAWIFIGGLSYGLTEGDILAVFSQYGEIVNINMVRQKDTGKTKGFCFICYANQKSTTLAVDNFNGIKLCGRTLRVDHVANYRIPKEHEDDDDITKRIQAEGCAPRPLGHDKDGDMANDVLPQVKIEKKKSRERKRSSSSDQSPIRNPANRAVKQEKYDPGYEKYSSKNMPPQASGRRNTRWNNNSDDGEAHPKSKRTLTSIDSRERVSSHSLKKSQLRNHSKPESYQSPERIDSDQGRKRRDFDKDSSEERERKRHSEKMDSSSRHKQSGVSKTSSRFDDSHDKNRKPASSEDKNHWRSRDEAFSKKPKSRHESPDRSFSSDSDDYRAKWKHAKKHSTNRDESDKEKRSKKSKSSSRRKNSDKALKKSHRDRDGKNYSQKVHDSDS